MNEWRKFGDGFQTAVYCTMVTAPADRNARKFSYIADAFLARMATARAR